MALPRFAVAACVYLRSWSASIHYLSFAGGIATAFLVRSETFRSIARRPASGILALACLAAALLGFESAYAWRPIFFLSTFFAFVAAGNDLFGLLSLRASLFLGDCSYGIYLLHGVVLFVVFQLLIGPASGQSYSPLMHWTVAMMLAPVVVLLAALSFRLIEQPALQQTNVLTGRLLGLTRMLRVLPSARPRSD